MKELILKHALRNAYLHNGKAEVGAVLAKILGEKPELKSKIKEVIKEINEVLKNVNKLSREEQLKRLEDIAPELLEKKVEEKELHPLPNAEKGKVVLRLPPEPSKYLHLGHGLSFMINYLYAKKYDGKLILRFEDSNPLKCKKEYFESIKQDLNWLGIKWDKEIRESEHIEVYYKKAKELIKNKNAYICLCPLDKVRGLRYKGIECNCRKRSVEENTKLWEKMFKEFKEGEAILRLKGDMKSKDTTFRDPTLFRIIDYEHCYTGKKYRVWPSYDFAVSIEDAEVTHVIRSAEFLMRTNLQNYLRKVMGYKKNPEIIHFSRFNIVGSTTQGRVIRELVSNKTVEGWDDPRLVTLSALRKRGIVPKTIEDLAYEVGITLAPKNIEYDIIFAFNRKNIDKEANRYFFVPNPIKLEVKNAPELDVNLKKHPEKQEYGRAFKTNGKFYVPNDDIKNLKKGDIFRLKDLYNAKLIKKTKGSVLCDYVKENILSELKIQWIPMNEYVKIELLKYGLLFKNGKLNKKSKEVIKGFGEKELFKLKIGDIVQFERVGFARKEKQGLFIFSHK